MTSQDFMAHLKRNADRYEQIKHLGDRVKFIQSGYAHTLYRVQLDEETDKLTDHDLVILCDRGNACFGGSAGPRRGGFVNVTVYTD